MAGIEGVATTPALALRSFLRRLNDRSRCCNLLLIIRGLLAAGLATRRIRLSSRRGCDDGLGYSRLGNDALLGDGRLPGGRRLCTALEHPQTLFELPVAVLQFLVLARELPELILKLLNTHFRIGIVGLR